MRCDGRFFGRYNRTFVESAQRFPELPRLSDAQRECPDLIDALCADRRCTLTWSIVAEGLQPALGQPVVIESKSGASGTLGVMEVLCASADGTTLLVSIEAVFTEVPHSMKVAFDPLKDLRWWPISTTARCC